MKAKRSRRAPMRELSGQFNEDDGIDPRELFQSQSGSRNRDHHKTEQLCRQVARTLDMVISGELDDESLSSLSVVDVRPAPTASQLLVSLQPAAGHCENPLALIAKLDEVAGRLRAAVAEAITRKRTPRLSFCIVPSASPDDKGVAS